MNQRTKARVAGFMFLFYIVNGIAGMIATGKARAGEDTAAKLASMAAHEPLMNLAIVLTLLTAFDALVLGVALYAITRDYDHDVAVLALSCRIVEGVIGAIASVAMLSQLSLALRSAGAVGADAAAAHALASALIKAQWGIFGATFFAVGSTLFAWLFLRARSIPTALAWLGVAASVLLVILLTAQLVGIAKSPVTDLMWIPMLVFEGVLGLWLLIKGVAAPAPRLAADRV
jgi:hypothetical protein